MLRLGQKNVNKFTGEKFPYYYEFFKVGVYGGKRKALAAARLERDRQMQRREFIEYLECRQYRLRLKQGESATGIAGVNVNIRVRYTEAGSESLVVEVRVLYRQQLHRVESPRKNCLFKSFCEGVALRDKLCGRKKRSDSENKMIFEDFLKRNKKRVRLLEKFDVPIWASDLKVKRRS